MQADSAPGSRLTAPMRERRGYGTAAAIAATLILAALAAAPASAAAPRPGQLDPSFGSGGVVTTAFNRSVPWKATAEAALRQPDGKMVIVADAMGGYPGQLLVARYEADGSLDPTFGSGGIATTPLRHA